MRLFTAIDLPADIRDRLADLIGRLRPLARINWSPASNLHLTTTFIGEWPEPRLPELRNALEGVSMRAIPIGLRGLGFFPNRRTPRGFYAGVDAPELSTLARDTQAALAKLGIEAESRAYTPHLTLARIKAPEGLASFHKAVEELGDPEFGSYLAERFFLYHSKPGASGSVYTKLSEFPISK
jgi:2'-5' RNA ligase